VKDAQSKTTKAAGKWYHAQLMRPVACLSSRITKRRFQEKSSIQRIIGILQAVRAPTDTGFWRKSTVKYLYKVKTIKNTRNKKLQFSKMYFQEVAKC
jgi:hypothetical protein